jgi:hypothetical protein
LTLFFLFGTGVLPSLTTHCGCASLRMHPQQCFFLAATLCSTSSPRLEVGMWISPRSRPCPFGQFLWVPIPGQAVITMNLCALASTKTHRNASTSTRTGVRWK